MTESNASVAEKAGTADQTHRWLERSGISAIADVLTKYGYLVFFAFVFYILAVKSFKLVPKVLTFALIVYLIWSANQIAFVLAKSFVG